MAPGPARFKVAAAEVNGFRSGLLDWYDRHRRTLPWRSKPGVSAEPYHVWLSEIMLQQTVVAAVIPYFTKFVEKWPTVKHLARAPQEEVMKEWAGLGYYARARNLYKCAQTVAGDYRGRFPDTREGLMALPGIGEYTSAAIAAIAFDQPATVIDGNVDRVIARYFAVEEPFPAGKKDVRHYAALLSEGRTDRPGDFAQAMMDLGATICIPKVARCGLCPVAKGCRARKMGIQNGLPAKLARKAKPQKHGYVYWITDTKGRVLLERRDERAMLGGMLALPVSPWVSTTEVKAHTATITELPLPPEEVKGARVMHSFTHFDLTLQGCRLGPVKAADFRAPQYQWVRVGDIPDAGLPSLFVKATKLFSGPQR